MLQTFDVVILGAGVMGLALAKELRERDSSISIAILDKEDGPDRHGSGRNSGVLHSGIYYPENSLKAKFCATGAQKLAEYCKIHKLPLRRSGKVILPTKPTDEAVLKMLFERGLRNGAHPKLIDSKELSELEPEARSILGVALHVPDTAVFDPKEILRKMVENLIRSKVHVAWGTGFVRPKAENSILTSNGEVFQYGHLINVAGLHSDRIAQSFGHALEFTMLPFKGLYFELPANRRLNINSLIYPVPDLQVPFLGVHVTKSIHDKIYLGPTAIPALGRENYKLLRGIDWLSIPQMAFLLGGQYLSNKQGFRQYAHDEMGRFRKRQFLDAVHCLVPSIEAHDLVRSSKVGIRAQMFNKSKRELVMDFLVQREGAVTHILNAVSPGFTSALSFAPYVLDHYFPQ